MRLAVAFWKQKYLKILGCQCYPYKKNELQAVLDHLLSLRAGGFTCAINAEKLARYSADTAFQRTVDQSIFAYPDGVGALVSLYLLYGVRASRLDLPSEIIKQCAVRKLRLILVGGDLQNVNLARMAIKKKYPSIDSIGGVSGYLKLQQYRTILQCQRPDVVLLGIGSPLQERVAAALSKGSNCLIVPCGGALDIWSGKTRRAPEFLQKIGLEWAWRLAREPKRIGRFGLLPPFFAKLIRSKARQK